MYKSQFWKMYPYDWFCGLTYFNQKWWFAVKNILKLDLFHLLSSPDVNWWTGFMWITCGLLWCFYQLFGLLFWRHPFTAEHPLMSEWCNATFLQIWWRNKLIYILDSLKVSTFSANFHFRSTAPLSQYLICIQVWITSYTTKQGLMVALKQTHLSTERSSSQVWLFSSSCWCFCSHIWGWWKEE